MGEKRTWDESRSPQWRYLLSRDSKAKRSAEKRREKAERELSRSGGASERKKQTQEEHQENRKLKSKSGREILYSASPGGDSDKNRYLNTEFVEAHRHKNKIKTPAIFDDKI